MPYINPQQLKHAWEFSRTITRIYAFKNADFIGCFETFFF